MDGRTDRVIPIYPPKLCVRGGINIFFSFSVSFTLEKEMKFFINIVSYVEELLLHKYYICTMYCQKICNLFVHVLALEMWRKVSPTLI